jgi:hypothetical protein
LKGCESENGENATSLNLNYSDTATWLNLSSKRDVCTQYILVEHEPETPQLFYFSKVSNQRKFSTNNSKGNLQMQKKCTVCGYSIPCPRTMFCFCCKLLTKSMISASSLSDERLEKHVYSIRRAWEMNEHVKFSKMEGNWTVTENNWWIKFVPF